MSSETSQWCNRNFLIGFTAKRGHAWHYRASDQGVEPNHYPDAIPVEDVQRRLFNWDAIAADMLLVTKKFGMTAAEERIGIVASDDGSYLGNHTRGKYEIHQYQDWLLHRVASLFGGNLHIGSAGLLRRRKQAWAALEIPDNITTPEGVVFRPQLVAWTSHDGSYKTTFKNSAVEVVCDNTFGLAQRGAGESIKFGHSRNSNAKFNVVTARDALNMIEKTVAVVTDEIRILSRIEVSDQTWNDFLRAHFVAEPDSARSETIVANKRAQVRKLWDTDPRVEPWRGTALGVQKAINTWHHHDMTVHRLSRAERNLNHVISGEWERVDAAAMTTLHKVLAAD